VRIHVVSLPHTLLTRDYDWCAYTAKVRRFVQMLDMRNIDALVYGPDIRDDDLERQAIDYVDIVDESDRQAWFGQPEWPISQVFDRWDVNDVCWRETNARAAAAIRERWQPGDILGIIGGACQAPIVAALNDLRPVVTEWGIGYSGLIAGTHRVYESYAWMHQLAGKYEGDDIRYFDTVIPNCFDSDDFDVSTKTGDYLLFMGRPNPRKGLDIIREINARTDLPLVVAGQPGHDIPDAEYVGVVTGKQKRELLAGARALLSPTTYLEPFGGVAVEAQMSGTPVIATDYGAFTETVINGMSGYRCRMLRDFLSAVDRCADLDRASIAARAHQLYSLQRGSQLYSDYLTDLTTLYGEGWYTLGTPTLPPR
jgi:glycosyltransferase involved in cell wall biosynthesis